MRRMECPRERVGWTCDVSLLETMSANDRLTRSLPHLQNLIKRDADAYREDVSEQCHLCISATMILFGHISSNCNTFISKVNSWN